MTRKARRILYKKCNIFVRLSIKKWETKCYPPPPFSFVYGPVFTYLWIISHQCNASESNFKDNLGVQDILIQQNPSNSVNSLLPAYATSVNVWDNMASLQWWSHQQRSDWSEISEWLTSRNYELGYFGQPLACTFALYPFPFNANTQRFNPFQSTQTLFMIHIFAWYNIIIYLKPPTLPK